MRAQKITLRRRVYKQLVQFGKHILQRSKPALNHLNLVFVRGFHQRTDLSGSRCAVNFQRAFMVKAGHVELGYTTA